MAPRSHSLKSQLCCFQMRPWKLQEANWFSNDICHSFLVSNVSIKIKLLQEICKALGETVSTLIKESWRHRDKLKFIPGHWSPSRQCRFIWRQNQTSVYLVFRYIHRLLWHCIDSLDEVSLEGTAPCKIKENSQCVILDARIKFRK